MTEPICPACRLPYNAGAMVCKNCGHVVDWRRWGRELVWAWMIFLGVLLSAMVLALSVWTWIAGW